MLVYVGGVAMNSLFELPEISIQRNEWKAQLKQAEIELKKAAQDMEQKKAVSRANPTKYNSEESMNAQLVYRSILNHYNRLKSAEKTIRNAEENQSKLF